MLKEISEQKFVHILCALTSSKYRVKSYQSLTFEEVPRAQQQRTNHDLACFICEKKGERERELMRCSFDLCTNYAHANCILTSKFNEDQESYFIYNLLDKNGHAFIDKIQERFTSDPGCFSGLTLCTLLPKKMRYFVCHLHNDLPCLVWCHCN